MNFEQITPWEEFKEKQYTVLPVQKDWQKWPAGLYEFYKDPEKNPLPTPTGKLEFWSESLENAFPNDEERPGIPKWIEKGITHDERISSYRARVYPLLVMSNHGRWRTHAQARRHPLDQGDGHRQDQGLGRLLVRTVLDAHERSREEGHQERRHRHGLQRARQRAVRRPGVGAHHAGRASRSTTAPAPTSSTTTSRLDRGGAINVIAPKGLTSKHAGGQATSGYLAEVERVSMAQMEEWRTKYPEAFARDYDPASGLRFNSWVNGGEVVMAKKVFVIDISQVQRLP